MAKKYKKSKSSPRRGSGVKKAKAKAVARKKKVGEFVALIRQRSDSKDSHRR